MLCNFPHNDVIIRHNSGDTIHCDDQVNFVSRPGFPTCITNDVFTFPGSEM